MIETPSAETSEVKYSKYDLYKTVDNISLRWTNKDKLLESWTEDLVSVTSIGDELITKAEETGLMLVYLCSSFFLTDC